MKNDCEVAVGVKSFIWHLRLVPLVPSPAFPNGDCDITTLMSSKPCSLPLLVISLRPFVEHIDDCYIHITKANTCLNAVWTNCFTATLTEV